MSMAIMSATWKEQMGKLWAVNLQFFGVSVARKWGPNLWHSRENYSFAPYTEDICAFNLLQSNHKAIYAKDSRQVQQSTI